MRPQTIVLASWGGAAAIITAQWVTNSANTGFPPPGRYLASGVLFSLLYVASAAVGPLAATIAAGTVFAMLLQPYLKGSQSGVLQTTAAYIGKLSGQPAGG